VPIQSPFLRYELHPITVMFSIFILYFVILPLSIINLFAMGLAVEEPVYEDPPGGIVIFTFMLWFVPVVYGLRVFLQPLFLIVNRDPAFRVFLRTSARGYLWFALPFLLLQIGFAIAALIIGDGWTASKALLEYWHGLRKEDAFWAEQVKAFDVLYGHIGTVIFIVVCTLPTWIGLALTRHRAVPKLGLWSDE